MVVIKPKPIRNLGMALLAGLAIGQIPVVRNAVDYFSPSEMERRTQEYSRAQSPYIKRLEERLRNMYIAGTTITYREGIVQNAERTITLRDRTPLEIEKNIAPPADIRVFFDLRNIENLPQEEISTKLINTWIENGYRGPVQVLYSEEALKEYTENSTTKTIVDRFVSNKYNPRVMSYKDLQEVDPASLFIDTRRKKFIPPAIIITPEERLKADK